MRKIYYLFLAAFIAPTMMFAQPANDNCSGAIPIEVNGDAVIADNTEATYSGPEGSCYAPLGDMTDGNVWFTITLTYPSILLITSEEGTSDDSQLTLFSIEDCGGPNEAYTEIACNEDEGWFNYMGEILTEELPAGTYYLSASTFSRADYDPPISNVGTFSISVTSASMPENDTCEGAIELILDGPAEIADNSISTINGPSGSCYGIPQLVGETWFMFTTTEVMDVRIHTEDIDSGDSQVSVFTIEGCGTENEVYTEVACNEDMSASNYMSQVDMYDLAPGTYYVKAGTYHEFFTGPYEIMLQSIVELPENDNCSGAIPIEVNGDAVIADNTNATYSGPEGSCYAPLGDMTDGNVWFSITLTYPAILLITSEEGTSEDSQLTLFSIEDCGGPNEAYTEIACNEDEGWFNYMGEILTDELPAGTYYLSASTFSRADYDPPISNVGTFSISVTTASMPENDTCEGAIELILDGPAEIADNSISTVNGPSGSCYGIAQLVGETWFMFTTTEVLNVRIHTEDIDSGDSQVSVFTIEGCGTENEVYTEVGCNDDMSGSNYMSQVDMYDLPAGTYYVKAGTYHEFFTGPYEIMLQTIEDAPVNSACEDAVIQTLEIDGPTVSVTGSATNAVDTEGISQPHVWEAFTIDDCADVTIDMCGTPVEPENYFIQIVDGCPIDATSTIIDASDYDIENCDGGEIANLSLTFVALPAGTYHFPIMSTPDYTVLDEYTVNFTAVSCAPEPDSCLYYAAGPWTNFDAFGGAPAPDTNGVCETYQITDFEVAASEAYIIENFAAGVTYTFSVCEGPNAGLWSPVLFVLDSNEEVVAYAESCSITWLNEVAGTYTIGIAEAGACYNSQNTSVESGYPTLTCEGSVGLSDADKANFSVYPNPNNGQFTIGNVEVSGNYTIEVMDIAGRVIHTQVSTLNANTEARINLKEVAPGVYMVKMINTNDNTQAVQRIVID